MHRDKYATREKIKNAVGELLVQQGMREMGVNSIAKQAGVDKVLIYRYFGNLEELLQAFAQESNLWPSLGELFGEKTAIKRTSDIKEVISSFLNGQLSEIRRRKATQEVLRWETIEENELTRALSSARSEQTSELLNSISMLKHTNKDLEALLALINAGITYLVLLSKVSDKHLGIDLHSNFGWQRLSNLINDLVKSYINDANVSAR